MRHLMKRILLGWGSKWVNKLRLEIYKSIIYEALCLREYYGIIVCNTFKIFAEATTVAKISGPSLCTFIMKTLHACMSSCTLMAGKLHNAGAISHDIVLQETFMTKDFSMSSLLSLLQYV